MTRETDVYLIDNSELVESQLSGIAGGIMELLEDTNPNSSGVAQMAPEEVAAEESEVVEEEVVSEEEPAAEAAEAHTFRIKVDGEEKTLSQAEILELAQKGFDYTKKTQKIAEEKNELAPYIGLANKIKGDPILAAQIAQLLSGQQPTVAAPKPVEPESDDPVEQLKAEIKRELRAEMEQKIAPMNKQQMLDRVKAQVMADPLFNDVQKDIIAMVKAQPAALQKDTFLRLDQDPEAYMQAFKHFKQIRLSKPEIQAANTPKPVATKTKAPILEAGGNVSQPSAINNKEKKEKLTKQKAKALRSGDTMELASWLVDSGALEHLY